MFNIRFHLQCWHVHTTIQPYSESWVPSSHVYFRMLYIYIYIHYIGISDYFGMKDRTGKSKDLARFLAHCCSPRFTFPLISMVRDICQYHPTASAHEMTKMLAIMRPIHWTYGISWDISSYLLKRSSFKSESGANGYRGRNGSGNSLHLATLTLVPHGLVFEAAYPEHPTTTKPK